MVELVPGTTIAGCRIEALAGRGGMGVVYLARHVVLDRDVALKVIAPEYAQDLGFRSRFLRESRVAARIDHPHVIPVYDAGEQDGVLYLTMQFVKGTDLRAELVRCGRFEPERAVGILSQVASALDAAHRHDLVHRDVKPANVLLTTKDDDDYAYLSDFGLTKHLESRARETRTGMFVGTTDYIAPEQVTGDPLDCRADVYSLGCVLYHALSGRVPYPREHEIAAATAHLTEPPPSLKPLRPELAERFDPIIARAMAKQPGDRYPSAGRLAAAAEDACRAVGGATRTSPAVVTKSEPKPAPAPGWYPEPGTGRKRWWAGTHWGDYAPEQKPGGSSPQPQPPGWYPEPGTGRLRLWTGTAWGEYADGGRHGPSPPRRLPSSRRRRWWLWAAAVMGALVVVWAIAASQHDNGTSGSSSSAGAAGSAPSSSSGARKSTHRGTPGPPLAPRSLGRQLTSTQLNAILVPKSAYQKLPAASDGIVGSNIDPDSDSYAIQGGIPSLKLCNSPSHIPGLGADSSSSYQSVTVLPGNIYFGSDAASFAGQGAKQLLAAAASEGPTCGWRSLSGGRLDDQTVRLTTDQEGPEGNTLHDDVILVRSGAVVLEVATAVFSGSHSSDAEILAEGAAKRLAQAEHRRVS